MNSQENPSSDSTNPATTPATETDATMNTNSTDQAPITAVTETKAEVFWEPGSGLNMQVGRHYILSDSGSFYTSEGFASVEAAQAFIAGMIEEDRPAGVEVVTFNGTDWSQAWGICNIILAESLRDFWLSPQGDAAMFKEFQEERAKGDSAGTVAASTEPTTAASVEQPQLPQVSVKVSGILTLDTKVTAGTKLREVLKSFANLIKGVAVTAMSFRDADGKPVSLDRQLSSDMVLVASTKERGS